MQVSCRCNHLLTELSGSLAFSCNEIRFAYILTHAEYDSWSCILILRRHLRNYNLNVSHWHQVVKLKPNTQIMLNFNIYQGWLVNLLQSQVTILFHWCAIWAPQTLQVTALMTVLHVRNKKIQPCSCSPLSLLKINLLIRLFPDREWQNKKHWLFINRSQRHTPKYTSSSVTARQNLCSLSPRLHIYYQPRISLKMILHSCFKCVLKMS